MASYDAQINILVAGQRNIQNLANQLNAIEDSIGQIERRWRSATGALQRANIRLGVTGTEQPRGEGGRFARDPDRRARLAALADQRRARVEQQLSRISIARSRAESLFTRNQIEGNERLISQTERRIAIEQRLNSAVRLFETRQEKFRRGGGGSGAGLNKRFREEAEALRQEASSIAAAFDAAGGASSRNLRLINSLATGLGRVVERQNELNRISALASKGFEAGRRLQERVDVVAERGVVPARRISNLKQRAESVIAAAVSGNQQEYSEALRRASAAVSRIERESKKLADNIVKNAPRSPVLGGINFSGSPKALKEAQKQQRDAVKENEKASASAVALDKQRQNALENILSIERKIQQTRKPTQELPISFKRITPKEARDYYASTGLQQLALPFGSELAPSVRGGARKGAAQNIEILGGARTEVQALGATLGAELNSKAAQVQFGNSGKALGAKFSNAFEDALSLGDFNVFEIFDKSIKKFNNLVGTAKTPRGTAQAGGTYRTGEFSPVDGKKRLENIIGSGAILEQSLINLERKGVDVTTEREKLQKALNAAKENGFDISLKTLDALDDQLTSARNFIRLQNTIRAGEVKGSKAAGSGLEAALKSLQEARGAGKAFLGGASPAEAIDKIVREFNTGKTAIGNAGQNAASTFVDNIKGAAGSAASAGKTFASSAAKAILKVFGIASPSRFMIELVKNLADTYVSQMEKEYPRIKAATAKAFGEQTLLRDVTKLRATNKGFEEYGRPSTGFRPFPLGAGTSGATSEFNDLINSFRKQIAELTTQPKIYGNLLNALPNSRITTDLVGAANRRAAASEIPSFMSTQRMLGPGELERLITAKLAEYLRDIKIPNPWVGAIGDYKEFIAKVVGETSKLRVPSFSGTRSLPQGQIAGLLPAAKDSIGNKFEDRIRQAFERSAQRGAVVFAEDATRRFSAGVAAISGGAVPPGVPPGGGGGTAGVGDGGAAEEGRRLLTLADARINQASINELEGLAQGLSQFRNALNPAIEGFDLLDNQLRETINNISDVLESRAPGTDPLMRRFPGRRGRAISEGLIGGAFPLLFGQGVGASVGGGLGGAAGALVGGGLGFGLSLAGTAIGAEVDKAVIAAGELNSAFLTVAGSYSEIRKQGIQFTAELESQVNLLKASGNFAAATQLERGAIQGATGDVNAAATEGVAAAGAVLSATWNETYKAIQTTLGIIASPFLFALNALLTPVRALFQGFNAIASLIANIPGVRELFAGWNEIAYKTTQEYQDQLAEIQKQIKEAGRLNRIQEEQLVYLRASLGLGQADVEILNRRAEAAKRAAENEKEIERIRVDNPSRTAEQRENINRLVFEQQKKFLLEEKAIAITGAQQVYQEIVELDRSLNRQRVDNELRYRDLVINRIREQRDLDLENSRKAEDIFLEVAQRRLAIEQKINQQRLEASKIATESLQIDRNLQATGNPVAQGVNEFLKAVDEYGLKLNQIGQEYSQEQKAKQLDLIQIQIQFERNKFDLAVRVSRINIDTQKQVASINREINRQNEDISRKQLARRLQANLEDIKYQDRLARASFELNKAAAMKAIQKEGGPDIAAAQIYKENMDYAYNTIIQFAPIIKDLQGLTSKASSLKTSLPEIGNVPSLNYDTSELDKAQSSLITAIKSGNDFRSMVNAIVNESKNLGNQLGSTISSILQQFDQVIQTSQSDYDIRERTVALLIEGMNPAIARQVASLDQAYETQKRIIDSSIEEIEVRVASNQALVEEAEALSGALNLRKDQNSEDYRSLRIQLDIVNAKILGNQALENELVKLRERAKLLDPTYNEARQSLIGSGKPVKGEKIQEFISQATKDLNDLESVAIRVSQSIGDAVGNSLANGISGLIEGTTTAKQIFADFLKSVGQILVQEGTKMIATYIAIGIAKAFAGLLGGGGNMGGQNYFNPKTGLGVAGPNFGLAKGGVFDSNGISAFAKGGMFSNSIVSSPTLFKFADGGAMRTGVMGEAGPEAIMPLRRGSDGRLGVEARGLREAMNGGSGAPVLNMSFETTNIGGVEYVSRDQLEAAMAATRKQASADGAKRGMSMTLDKLQQSPQTRSRLGIRS